MTDLKHSHVPWTYNYNPYMLQRGDDAESELAAFEIFDAEQNRIFDTNEDMPSERQEANARLAAAAPALLGALLLAQQALNAARRFPVGDTDSYKIAGIVDDAIAKARAA